MATERRIASIVFLHLFSFMQEAAHWEIVEIPLYVLMGAIGGALGALYNYLNYRLSVFRAQFIHRKPMKVSDHLRNAFD